jgi:hypothetical protein
VRNGRNGVIVADCLFFPVRFKDINKLNELSIKLFGVNALLSVVSIIDQ